MQGFIKICRCGRFLFQLEWGKFFISSTWEGSDFSVELHTEHSHISRVMDLIRHLTHLTMQYNFSIKAQHIPGKRNEIVDSLSRFQHKRFRELAPLAVWTLEGI